MGTTQKPFQAARRNVFVEKVPDSCVSRVHPAAELEPGSGIGFLAKLKISLTFNSV